MGNFTEKTDLRIEWEKSPGPTVEHGSKAWWLNGKRHREDGPAFEYPDGPAVETQMNQRMVYKWETAPRRRTCG